MYFERNINKNIYFLVALVSIMSIQPALAEWAASAEGPDVFGVTKVIAINKDVEHSLIIQCDDKDAMSIAYLIEKKKFDEVTSLPAVLIIQADQSTPIRLTGEFKGWNDNYAAIAAEGRSEEAAAAIRAIQSANGKINVGVQIGDVRESASFDTDGSTASMTKVMKGCKFSSGVK